MKPLRLTRARKFLVNCFLILGFILLINENSGEYQRTGAICRDGWGSSATGRGACSHHGGVREWTYREVHPPLLPPMVRRVGLILLAVNGLSIGGVYWREIKERERL